MKTKIMLILGIMFCISLTTRAQNLALEFDQAMSQMSQQERQAVIMEFWQSAVQTIASGNQRGLAVLQTIAPVIRKYDRQFDQHWLAAARTLQQIANSWVGPLPSWGGPSGMMGMDNVFEDLENERGARHEQFRQQNHNYWKRHTGERLMNMPCYQ